MEDHWVTFIVCLLASGAAMLVARKIRNRSGSRLFAVAVWITLAFVSFLLTLIISRLRLNWYHLDAAIVAFLYTYFMEDARFFKTLQK